MTPVVLLYLIAFLAALAVLILPLIRQRKTTDGDASPALEVYRAQLAELDRDAASGAIPKTDAESARHEIERRILAADDINNANGGAPRYGRPHTRTAIGVALVVPALAIALYLSGGRPDLPSRPMARIVLPTIDDLSPPDLARLIGLRSATDAGGAEPWAELARFYIENGLIKDGEGALSTARALAPDDASLAGLYGEISFFLSQGFVTQEALDAFRAALEIDPTDARGLFYLAVARQQAGYPENALNMWAAQVAILDPEDPWMEKTIDRIEAVAQSMGADPFAYIPPTVAIARGGELAGRAIAQMSPEERQAAIHQMVDQLAARLEDNPNDLAGWMRLARSRMELSEHARAARAFARADALARQDSVPFLMSWAAALIQTADNPAALPDELTDILDRVLVLEPDHADALWYAGIMAARRIDGQSALVHWRRLLEILPTESQIRPMVTQAIAAISSDP